MVLRTGKRHVFGSSLLASACVLACLLTFIGAFAQYVYPAIPEQFGGGEGKNVQLLFDATAKNAQTLRDVGVVIGKSDVITAPMRLLFEGDENYVLGMYDPVYVRPYTPSEDYGRDFRVVQVSKKLVSGLVVVGETQYVPVKIAKIDKIEATQNRLRARIGLAAPDICTYADILDSNYDDAKKRIDVTIEATHTLHALCPRVDSPLHMWFTRKDKFKVGSYSLHVDNLDASYAYGDYPIGDYSMDAHFSVADPKSSGKPRH